MFAAHLLRRTVPLTLLSICACAGSDKVNATYGSTLATLADGATSCGAAGGQVLTYGIDKNTNGVLDASEVAGTFDVCKGSPATLTKLANIVAGAQCAEGGVLVENGADSNANGTLEDAEVTTQTPVCGAGGQITSILGNLQVNSAEDAAHFAHVETVSGNLSVGFDYGFDTVTLPNLRSVALRISAYSNKNSSFALNGCWGICPITETLSLPELTQAGSVQMEGSTELLAPALTTVDGGLDCEDPNAVFPALTSASDIGEDCGVNLWNQFIDLPGSAGDVPGVSVFPNLVSTGVATDANGIVTNWNNGRFYLTDPNTTSVSAPHLTRIGYLLISGVWSPSASISMPELTTVGRLSLYNNGIGFGLVPPSFHSFATVNVPKLTTSLGYVQESDGQSTPSLLAAFHTIGGALWLRYTGETVLNLPQLTQSSAIDVTGNADLVSFSAPAFTGLVASDGTTQNFPGALGDGLGISCDDLLPSDLRCQSLVFQDNPNLTTVALGAAGSVPGMIYLINNPNLATVTGLSAVTSLAGSATQQLPPVSQNEDVSLYISGTNLTSLAPFSSITSLGGALAVVNNPELTSLGGLALTGSATTCPWFYNNPKLKFCEAQAFATAYNAACVVAAPADTLLKDPCAGEPCGVGAACDVDCSQGTGYSCPP